MNVKGKNKDVEPNSPVAHMMLSLVQHKIILAVLATGKFNIRFLDMIKLLFLQLA
jgi:hypothetical protein